MFKKFTLKNFRTHVDTVFEPKDVTLIIGSNNSGKSNLLFGLNYFSRLISSAFPGSEKSKMLKMSNLSSHRHSLSDVNTPMIFSCEWEKEQSKLAYEIQLYCINEKMPDIACKEKLSVFTNNSEKIIKHGYDAPSQEMLLRTKLETEDLTSDEKKLTDLFFRSLSFIHYYHFQPAFLKGQALPLIQGKIAEKKNFEEILKDRNSLNIANEIGREGSNFQELVRYVKEHDEIGYNKFLGYLKRFVKSFNGIIIDKGVTKWQFDMGGSKFPYFESDKISDGLLKAGAVALLCAMKRPPAIIMIEEIENGINQKNLSEFLSWLSEISQKGMNTQFILTSHNPSVIREFSHRLDAAYKLHLREKDYRSIITNLNDALIPLANMGTIDGELVEKDGKQIIQVQPYALTELFYNGVLGQL